MTAITPQPKVSLEALRDLRAATGAGVLDARKALQEANGDLEKATDLLRSAGMQVLPKMQDRVTLNGAVVAHVSKTVGTLVEVNCETDFVAKSQKFADLLTVVLQAAANLQEVTVENLLSVQGKHGTVQENIEEASSILRERLVVKRVARVTGAHVEAYLHKTNPDLPPQVGVLVATNGTNVEVAREVALQLAAFPAIAVTREDLPASLVEAYRSQQETVASQMGKSEEIAAKIVEGRMKAFYAEQVLTEQVFGRDDKLTVGNLLASASVTVTYFARFRVGE